MRKSAILLIVVIVVLIGALVFVFIRKDEPTAAEVDAAIESFQEAPEPITAAPAETPAPGTPAPELKFDNELSFTGSFLTVDDQKPIKLACSHEPDSPAAVGRIFLDDVATATLSCADTYLGSVALNYEDAEGQQKRIDLSMQDQDAGDFFDLRAWIHRDPTTKTLVIDLLGFDSSDGSIAEDGADVCHLKSERLTWKKATKTFERQETKPDLSKAAAPVNAAKACLDEKDHWKGP